MAGFKHALVSRNPVLLMCLYMGYHIFSGFLVHQALLSHSQYTRFLQGHKSNINAFPEIIILLLICFHCVIRNQILKFDLVNIKCLIMGKSCRVIQR